MESNTNTGFTYPDRIDAAGRGMSVLDFYAGRYRHSTREEWRERLRLGLVTRNGARAGESDLLAAGDLLEYHRPPWTEPAVPDDIPVLYEDDALIAFAKPVGLPVLPGGGYLQHTMLAIVRERHGTLLSPVQRLDRGASGVIVFSKTRESAIRLSAAFREKRVRKSYLVIVRGIDMPDAFDIAVPRLRTQTRTLPPRESRCTTLWRDAGKFVSLVMVQTSSGETHQVRRHLWSAGWPLAGDPLFTAPGAPLDEEQAERAGLTGACGYLLHAWKLFLPHPIQLQPLEIIAPPPIKLKVEN